MTATMTKATANYHKAVAKHRRAEENMARIKSQRHVLLKEGPKRKPISKVKAYERALRELRQARRARRRALRRLLYRQERT